MQLGHPIGGTGDGGAGIWFCVGLPHRAETRHVRWPRCDQPCSGAGRLEPAGDLAAERGPASVAQAARRCSRSGQGCVLARGSRAFCWLGYGGPLPVARRAHRRPNLRHSQRRRAGLRCHTAGGGRRNCLLHRATLLGSSGHAVRHRCLGQRDRRQSHRAASPKPGALPHSSSRHWRRLRHLLLRLHSLNCATGCRHCPG